MASCMVGSCDVKRLRRDCDGACVAPALAVVLLGAWARMEALAGDMQRAEELFEAAYALNSGNLVLLQVRRQSCAPCLPRPVSLAPTRVEPMAQCKEGLDGHAGLQQRRAPSDCTCCAWNFQHKRLGVQHGALQRLVLVVAGRSMCDARPVIQRQLCELCQQIRTR